ncbi:MAG: glycosyltransferase family 2 protein [Pyrinomonadaceae bacterium]
MSRKQNDKETGRPFVSVIMPVRNEAAFIRRSLTAVLQQNYPQELLEIVVADGMSADATRDIIEDLARGSEIPIFVVDNPKLIAAAGLNRALEKAGGEIIVRVDGHCEIEPDYVENCVLLLTSGKADGVGGPIETIGESARARAIALAMSSSFGVGGSAFRTIDDREMYTDTVAFPGYTRAIIEKAGPFNEELIRNQDDEYNFRIRKLGGRILLSPRIRSRYYSRATFKRLWRQYYEYGYWKIRVMQLHPRQMSARQFIPAIFVFSLILSAILALFSTLGRAAFVLVIAAYLIANLSAAVVTARAKLKLIPSLSLSFAILHFSYGWGFIVGLIAFRNRGDSLPISDLSVSKR